MIDALADLLVQAQWQIVSESGRGDGVLRATFGGGAVVQFRLASARATKAAANELVVVVYDDAFELPKEKADWVDLPLIATRAGRGGECHARFGWDLVFGFGGGTDRPSRLTRYLAWLRDRHPVAATATEGEIAKVIMKVREVTRTRPASSADIQANVLGTKQRWHDLQKRNALIAYRGCVGEQAMDQACFLVSSLIAGRIDAMSGDGTSGTCVPLLLLGEDMRLDGLTSALRGAFWQATGKSYSDTFYGKLARLGYVHLFVANGEALRVDQDFDPNTRFITELFMFCEEDGRFTLCCARDHVFHEQAPEPVENETPQTGRWEIGALRTLGQRFFLAEDFYIVDFGARKPADLALIAAHGEGSRSTVDGNVLLTGMKRLARNVSERSGGRCSDEEAIAAFAALGALRPQRDAGVFARGDLRSVAADILTAERRRPAHVSIFESALAQSGAFIELSGGRFTLRDGLIAEYLLAESIANALRYALIVDEAGELEALFSARIAETRMFELACHIAEIDRIPNIGDGLGKLMATFNLYSGPGEGEQVQAENMFRLLFAAIAHLIANDAGAWTDRRSALVRTIANKPIKLKGMAIPQFCFRDMNLGFWTFENCNFRSAVFVNAELQSLVMDDCYLGGAAFKNSRLDWSTRLPNSNLSGAWFGGGSSVEGLFTRHQPSERLAGVNWTMSFIDVTASQHDGEDLIDPPQDTPAKFELLREAGGTLTDVSILGRDDKVERSESPPEFLEALLRGVWPGAVIEESSRSWRIVDPLRHATERREGPVDGLVARFLMEGSSGLIAVGADGRVWGKGLAFGDERKWSLVSSVKCDGAPQSLACFDGDREEHSAVLAVAVRKDNHWFIEIIEAPKADFGAATRATVRCREDDPVTAMKWVRPSSRSPLVLYFGTQAGDVWQVQRSNLGWAEPKRLGGSQRGVPVSALCHARRSRVMVAAYSNGLVIGAHTAADEDEPPLFSFKTAMQRVFGLAYLEGEGDQMIFVGSVFPQTRTDDHDGFVKDDRPLCILLNAAGDVLAVFPRDIDLGSAASSDVFEPMPTKRVAAHVQAGEGEASPTAARQIGSGEVIQQWLDQYAPLTSSLELRPLSGAEQSLNFQLNSNTVNALAPVIETADGPAFRQVTLRVSSRGEDGRPIRPIQEIFTDHEMRRVQHHERQLQIDVVVRFGLDTASADVALTVAYMLAGTTVAARTWPIAVDVLWRDNPYEASGRATGAAQFHGRNQEIAQCAMLLASGKGVGLRAARRIGKSSFLSSVARELTNRGHLAVVISLAGSARPSADLASIILKGAEDPLAPAPAAFVEQLKHGLQHTGHRGRDALELFGQLARSFSKSPAVVLIDEWGVVASPESSQVDEAFEQEVGELIQNPSSSGVAICLASAPGDFVFKPNLGTSSCYRGLQDTWLDLGPMEGPDIKNLLEQPIEKRGGRIRDGEDCLRRLMALSTGDPYAANVIMSRAYDAALARAGSGGTVEITPDDIDNDAMKRVIASIYEVHMGYTYDRLSPTNRALLREEARADTPPWEREPIFIPEPHNDPREWKIFSAAGFRRKGEGANKDRFVVWLPRGYSLNVLSRG